MENDLRRDDVRQLVRRIAIPSMLAQFVSVLYSIVDRMYIGHIPQVGNLALAGVGVCGPVVTLVGSVASLVGMGGSPLMSIRMGEGDDQAARAVLANCFMLLCVFSVVLVAVLIPLRQPMLMLFGASETTLSYANEYFTIYLAGTIFALMATGLNTFVVCQGFARKGMMAVILGAVLNIILDPIFIFALNMGVAGAALATVLSQAASCAFILIFLFGRRATVRITFGGYSARIIVRVLTLGFSPVAIIAVDNIMIIALNFMLVVTMPLGGISGGTQGILGFNYGARQPRRVQDAQRHIFRLCLIYTSIMFLMAWIAGGIFTRLFTSDPVIMEKSVWAIHVCTLAIIPLGLQYEVVDGFTAIGQVRYALPLSFWRKAVYFAALFVLPALFGAEAVFFAEPISDVVGPVTSVAVHTLCWKKILVRR